MFEENDTTFNSIVELLSDFRESNSLNDDVLILIAVEDGEPDERLVKTIHKLNKPHISSIAIHDFGIKSD